MSAPTPPPDSAAAPKKKSKLPMIIALVVLLAAGGGGGGYFFFMRAGAATKEGGEKEKKEKGGKEHGGGEEEAPAEGEEGEEHHAEEGEEEAEGEKTAKHSSKKAKKDTLSMPDDSKVKEVIELQPFIVNLADPGESHYLRLTVNVGVGGGEEGGEGGEEGKPNPLFMTRVRNAMLAVLTTKTSDEVLTAEGKNALRKELLKAARKVSEEPKVYAIYITDFIVQL